jgi:soluble lytic murein transglycosylase-like protein
MAGATVIDQLIVKLGLDPRDFTKGQKQIANEMIKTEGAVKKSSASMGSSIAGLTGKLLAMVAAVISVKKIADGVSELSVSVRQLGIDSRNFRMAANEMRNFQNVGEMMGGKAEDVTKTIGNLTKAVYDLAYNGQISDSLIMLGRLGVQFQDTAGNARNFRDIVLDTQTAIQGQLKRGTSYANAAQMLSQAGFDPGLTRAMLEGTVGKQLAQQEARRQVNGESLSAAEAWEKSATNRDQAVEAAALRGLPGGASAGVATNNALAKGAEYASDATVSGVLGDTAEKIKAGANKLVDAFENIGARVWRSVFPKGRRNYEAPIQHAATQYGLDPEMLAALISAESDFDPSAVSSAGATGIAQLMPKYFPGAGRSPDADIHTAAAYLRALKDNFQRQGYSEDDQYILALRSYNAGQSRVQESMKPGGKPLAQETINYPNKVRGYMNQAQPTPGAQGASGAVNNTEINISKIDVSTQATNAEGVAAGLDDAIRRKTNAAQADKGMQ